MARFELPRRTLLKAAVAAPFVLRYRDGIAGSAKVTIGQVPPQPLPANIPAEVFSWGFTKVTFQDNFSTLSTIDLGQTRNPGYKWYPLVAWPHAFIPGYQTATNPNPAGISLNASPLVNGTHLTKSAHFTLTTACGLTSGPGYHGQVFSGGGYFEASLAFDPTLANASNPSWPSFWSLSTVQLAGGASPGIYVEPDFFEGFPTGSGTISPLMGAHAYTLDGSGNITSNNSNSNFAVTLPGSPTFTNFNRYGTLWVPQALAIQHGGSLGFIKRFFNGVAITAGTTGQFFYSSSAGASPAFTPSNPTGVFSYLDSAQIFLILACGDQSFSDWPMDVNNVIAVQAP